MAMQAGRFVWYELMTTDLDAAQAFYGKVVGWGLADAGMPGFRYTIASVGEARVAGMCAIPDEVCAQGGRPGWVGFVGVPNVDAAAAQIGQAGGGIRRAPDDIPGIGRFAVVADPQGAGFMLFAPSGERPPQPAPGTPGSIGWHELHAKDWEAAFGFYSGLFGWRKTTPVDMGPMGTYQLFAGEGPADIGGMMSNAQVPQPFWLYYFTVTDIDAALVRVSEAGGAVKNGPHEVPGGMWIIHATDPQGVLFALVGQKRS